MSNVHVLVERGWETTIRFKAFTNGLWMIPMDNDWENKCIGSELWVNLEVQSQIVDAVERKVTLKRGISQDTDHKIRTMWTELRDWF